jgi:DNA polymerase-3 subunit alpha
MSRMTVEDFSGSYEFAFFGKDHETYLPYQKVNSAVLIEGVIEERYRPNPKGKKDEKTGKMVPDLPDLIFKMKNIMLLGNVAEERITGLSINVTTTMLSPDFREKLVKMLKRNKGKTPLTMFLYDPVKKWNIEFLSHKFKVQVTNEFLEELKSLGIRYTVSKK